MAKATEAAAPAAPAVKVSAVAPAQQESASEPQAAVAPVKRSYRVHLDSRTPLHKNPAISEDVANEGEAWAVFCQLNGISGSDHPRTIRPL